MLLLLAWCYLLLGATACFLLPLATLACCCHLFNATAGLLIPHASYCLVVVNTYLLLPIASATSCLLLVLALCYRLPCCYHTLTAIAC